MTGIEQREREKIDNEHRRALRFDIMDREQFPMIRFYPSIALSRFFLQMITETTPDSRIRDVMLIPAPQ